MLDNYRSRIKDFKYLWLESRAWLLMALVLLMAYGYLLSHETVGIDDTPYGLYFQDGLAVVVGRWVVYLLNKLLPVAEFAGFLPDLLGVAALGLGSMVYVLPFYRQQGGRARRSYVLFACILATQPLWSEVLTYYLHNGVGLGLLFGGLALCKTQDMWDLPIRLGRAGHLAVGEHLAQAAIWLTLSIGCYESFMIVYLVGGVFLLLAGRIQGQGAAADMWKPLGRLALAGLTAGAAMLGRMAAVWICMTAFHLEPMKELARNRSLTEVGGWLGRSDAASHLVMLVKRHLLLYGIFGLAYQPIALYVAASLLALAAAVWLSWRNKDLWMLPLLLLALGISHSLLVVGQVILYRSAQFVPLWTAFGFWLGWQACSRALERRRALYRGMRRLAVLAVALLLLAQALEMNKWFYVDYQKYQAAISTMDWVDHHLSQQGWSGRPVVFTGSYRIPVSLLKNTYVEYNTPLFYRLQRLSAWVDPHVLEKYYRPEGVWVAQTPALSVIEWGKYAFESNAELAKFASMHGWTLRPWTEVEWYAKAEALSQGLPSFPSPGSVVDGGEYVIVHF